MRWISQSGFAKGRWLCSFAAVVLLAGLARAQEYSSSYDPDWVRNLRIGAFVGLNIKAEFSASGPFNISGHAPGVYDDGYVLVDQTGNAQGLTSYWGYQNSSQYNAGAQTLTMHSATSYSGAASPVSKSDEVFVGFEMAYGGTLWRHDTFRVGWEAGFGLLPINIKDTQNFSTTANRSAFSFNTGSIVLPTAPYNGGPSGIGPVINATPTPLAGDIIAGTVSSSRTLEVNLYTLRLGPTIYWDFTDYLGLSASVGGAIGLVSGDFKFDETISLADGSASHNRGQISGNEFTYGGYVNAMITYHAVQNGDFYVGVQYMPLNSATISGGGRQARLDLRGQLYISAGINWPF